jgi:hypothetical protein
MIWPQALIAELAERRAVVLLGAGASAASVNSDGKSPPNWIQLLDALQARTVLDDDEVGSINYAKEQGRLLDAAELILAKLPAPELRTALRELLLLPKFGPSVIHECVREIDPKIIITTNYDTIYDEFCRQGNAAAGYSVKTHTSDDLLDEIRSTARVVIKAHGCVTDPQHIVLSRYQFFQAKARNPSFYSILNSIFLTSTILFLGYSLQDPDISLVLEGANISVPCAHPHYALVPSGLAEPIKFAMTKAYNVRLLEYEHDGGDHSNGVKAIESLRDAVLSYRASYSNP